MDNIIASILGTGVASLCGFGLWWSCFRRGHGKTRPRPPTVILVRNGVVADATPGAEEITGTSTLCDTPWEDLRDALRQRFPHLPDAQPDGPRPLHFIDDAGLQLSLTRSGETLRIRLDRPAVTPARLFRLESRRTEGRRLRRILDYLPMPAWQSGPGGDMVWHNAAFDEICRRSGRKAANGDPFVRADGDDGAKTRASVVDKHGEKLWYEVEGLPFDDGTLHVACDIGSLVTAEHAQRQFVQTLSKTFAHLPIGLAVFGSDHRLALFNPALVDLTRLQGEFLSGRPTLRSFFDILREDRMMPEPKNYATWRDRLSEMIKAAQDDRFCETWTLENGLTYKVTGRPHPDGAVAFLFEDISAEISLTRRFRSELMVTQSVLDSFEDGVAVFSHNGVLVFCNARYREIWRDAKESALPETNVLDAARLWQRASEGGPDWRKLSELILDPMHRHTWHTEFTLHAGERLLCRASPAANGATLLRFSRTGNEVAQALASGQ